jgi:sugar transferase (PEP-CTERM/EpsH1 system associated)
MRILWLKSDLLLPLDKGGKIRTWHLLCHLARRHEITYVGCSGPETSPADIDGMHDVAARVVTVPRSDPPKGSMRFYLDAAAHLADPLPYAVAKYRSPAYAAAVGTCLRTGGFDLIVCDFLVPAVNLPRDLPCPAVLFTHNVESEIWRRHTEMKTSAIGRLLYGAQYRRMLRFEARTLARFDGVLAVSEADRDTFERIYPGALRGPIYVVPTGVDTEFFAPGLETNSRELVFTGSMDWLPNEDAMSYFCRDILPRIRANEPETALSIVGRSPTPAVSALAADSAIRVTGRVDDVRPYVQNAAIYVVPLRIGGGTRLKIFEAMAMGKAVVSTSVGAEGLPVTDGEDIVLADTPAEFATAVLGLLRDSQQRARLGDAARALVVDRYDWSAVAGALEAALERFAANPLVTSTDAVPANLDAGLSAEWSKGQ